MSERLMLRPPASASCVVINLHRVMPQHMADHGSSIFRQQFADEHADPLHSAETFATRVVALEVGLTSQILNFLVVKLVAIRDRIRFAHKLVAVTDDGVCRANW